MKTVRYFCPKCKSMMIPGPRGFSCRKCGYISEKCKTVINPVEIKEDSSAENGDSAIHENELSRPTESEVSFTNTGPSVWDSVQKEIIEAPSNQRILVDAGPGTGKTAIACARVAWLIDKESLTPGNIWVISFTRTAVHEIRNRIRESLEQSDDGYAVNIATIDSRAWMIHSGFDKTANLHGGYTENIEKMIRLIRSNDDVAEYLRSTEHIIIDESQDIVGPRKDLIMEIIKRVPQTCGITVFADEAQAIYGFAMDEDSQNTGTRYETLVHRIRRISHNPFTERSLQTIYRTRSPYLKKLFLNTRKRVKKTDYLDKDELKSIKKEIRELAHDKNIPPIQEQKLEAFENGFILYRRRAEVLWASYALKTKPHRIRMSGLPQCVRPWVGACLSEYTESRLSKSDFIDLWEQNIIKKRLEDTDYEKFWKLIRDFAGITEVTADIRRLRQILGRSQPPGEFCYPEIGQSGPIIGTIHASKGRETDNVRLMIPSNPHEEEDYQEEARVIFVGATRSRKRLETGKGYWYPAQRVSQSGRVYSMMKDKPWNTFTEIGREGDIKAPGIAGLDFFSDADAVRKNQKILYSLSSKISLAVARTDPSSDFTYRLYLGENGEGKMIGCLSNDSVNVDLFRICDKIQESSGCGRRRPPKELKNLRIFGIRTIAVPPDSSDSGKLFEPWAKSGFMTAPIVLGLAWGYYSGRGYSGRYANSTSEIINI